MPQTRGTSAKARRDQERAAGAGNRYPAPPDLYSEREASVSAPPSAPARRTHQNADVRALPCKNFRRQKSASAPSAALPPGSQGQAATAPYRASVHTKPSFDDVLEWRNAQCFSQSASRTSQGQRHGDAVDRICAKHNHNKYSRQNSGNRWFNYSRTVEHRQIERNRVHKVFAPDHVTKIPAVQGCRRSPRPSEPQALHLPHFSGQSKSAQPESLPAPSSSPAWQSLLAADSTGPPPRDRRQRNTGICPAEHRSQAVMIPSAGKTNISRNVVHQVPIEIN